MAAFVPGSFYFLTGGNCIYKALTPDAALNVSLVPVANPGAPGITIGDSDTGFLVLTVAAADPGYNLRDRVSGPDGRAYRVIAAFDSAGLATSILVCQSVTDASSPPLCFLKADVAPLWTPS